MSVTPQKLEILMPVGLQIESDEPEMESSLHYLQLALLVACLDWLWQDRNDYFIGANLTIFYSREQLKNRDFRGPDFFLVKNTEKRHRTSWVIWEENGQYPDLIIELLSDSTARVDKNLKKLLYQNEFGTAEYFWFSPSTLEFIGFRLMGDNYQEIPANEAGLRWSQSLQLYLGIYDRKLRYFTLTGELVPTPEEAATQAQQRAETERQRAEAERQIAETERQIAETERQRAEAEQQRAEAERQRAEAEQQRAEAERQRAEAERQRAEAERQRAEKLAAQLRSLGIDPQE